MTAEGLADEDFQRRKQEIHAQHKEDLKEFDIKVIQTLDEKVMLHLFGPWLSTGKLKYLKTPGASNRRVAE